MSNDDDQPTRILPPQSQKTQVAPQRTEIAPPPEPFTPDGDATVIRPRPARAPSNDDGNHLPVGFYLGEFEITKVLGEGGFGIVYLAEDHSLGRRVALKEYMPSSLAQRVGGTQVSVKSERHRETFEAGLKSFVNEARLLAQFDHPSLVKVYRFWEANGTAYMVMPFYEGITLKDELKAMGAPPDEAWLRELLEPLTEALAVIHAEQCFHRDIAPDNVILLKGSNRPLLLDFGAARRVIGDMTQALTVILKPGYAPVEQYAEVPGMKQGPWTDVYALAAVVYYAITGKTPPTSVGRLMNDNYVPMTQAGAGRYSPGFLAAMDRALVVKPEQRTQSIDDLRRDLGMAASDPDPGRPSGVQPRRGTVVGRPAHRGRRCRPRQDADLRRRRCAGRAGDRRRRLCLARRQAGRARRPWRPDRRRRRATPAAAADRSRIAGRRAADPPAAGAGRAGRARGGRSVRSGARVRARRRRPVARLQGRGCSRQAPAQDRQGHDDVQGEDREGRLSLCLPVRHRRRHRPGLSERRGEEQPDACRHDAVAAFGKGQLGPSASAGRPGTDHLHRDRLPSSARFFRARPEGAPTASRRRAPRSPGQRPRRRARHASIFAGRPVCQQPCTDDYGTALFTVEEIN